MSIRNLRRAAILVSPLAIIALLHTVARYGLRGPTGFSSEELSSWFDDPIGVVATIARWLALVLAYYLAAVMWTVFILQDRLEESRVGRLMPRGLAATFGTLLGIGAVVLPLTAHMSNTAEAPIATTAAEPLTIRQLDEPLTIGEPTRGQRSDTQVLVNEDPGSRVVANADATWTTRSGDSFWSIAAETLSEDLGRTDLSDTEIAVYWRHLIDVNTDRLLEPGNPDLILPGQVFLLPPLP